MVYVLLLRQVGFFEVIIRYIDGRLHQWASSIVELVGRIGLPLSLIRVAFGRLWVCVGGCWRRGGIGLIGLIGLRRILIGVKGRVLLN